MFDFESAVVGGDLRLGRAGFPRPVVAEEGLRQEGEFRRLRTAVVDRDQHEDVVGRGLGVFHEDIEITVRIEQAGVEQFKLRLIFPPPAVHVNQLFVGKGRLRILVKELQVGIRGRGIEVIIELLDVLAMVALGIGEAEEAFLEDGVLAVPEREREAEMLPVVAEAGEAVLAPAIRAAAGVIVGEIFPGIAAGGVVFAHRAPLAFGKVRTPAPPVGRAGFGFREALFLSGQWGGGFRGHGAEEVWPGSDGSLSG